MAKAAHIAILLTGVLASGAAKAQVIADSVTEFSGGQGQGGWHYGYYDGDAPTPFTPQDFEPFPLFGTAYGTAWSRTCACAGGYWTFIDASGGHPNGITGANGRRAETNWAVRRWVSDHAGQVLITGRTWKVESNSGNGVRCSITVDGVEVWSATNVTTVGSDYRVGACIGAGSVIDWAIDPVGGDERFDHTGFTATVTARECYADCDCSADLDVFDFLCFQNRFAINDPYACDCDTGSGPGVCDIFDFLCFQNAFDAGCP